MNKSAWVDYVNRLGTPLSQDEVQFLEDLKGFIEAAIEQRSDFRAVMSRIDVALSEIDRRAFKYEAASRKDWVLKAKDVSGFPRAKPALSKEEIQFLEDLKGFIDYGLRNGVTFSAIVGTIAHDTSELARSLFDYQAAAKRFLPKVTGYSKITPESFQGAEEE